MKPVRFLFYIFVSFFVPDRTRAFPSFWTFWPTETLHWFIQSQFVNKKQRINLLLLRRFVFRMVWERGARETRVTGDDAQGTKGRVKRRLACFLLPAFFYAPIFIERETSGYGADKGLQTVRELPTWTTASLLSTVMFDRFHNQSPLH